MGLHSNRNPLSVVGVWGGYSGLNLAQQYVVRDSTHLQFYAHIQTGQTDTTELVYTDTTWWRDNIAYLRSVADPDSSTVEVRNWSHEGIATHPDLVYFSTPYGPTLDTSYWRNDSAWEAGRWYLIGGMTARDDTAGSSIDSVRIDPRDPVRLAFAFTPLNNERDENPSLLVANSLPQIIGSANEVDAKWTRYIGPAIGDGWTDTIEAPLFFKNAVDYWAGSERSVQFQADVDGFLDKNGRYWLAWRIKYNGDHYAVVITGTDDMTTWDSLSYVIGEPGEDTTADSIWMSSELVSPTFLTDANGVYRMFAVLLDRGDNATNILDTNFVGMWSCRCDTPDSTAGWRLDSILVVRKGQNIQPKTFQGKDVDIWHIDVLKHGSDELVMIAAAQESFDNASGNVPIWLLTSSDGGINWVWAPEPTITSASQTSSDWSKGGYRASGLFRNDSAREVLELYYGAAGLFSYFVDTSEFGDGLSGIIRGYNLSNPDTGAGVGAHLRHGSWHIGHASVYFDQPDSQ